MKLNGKFDIDNGTTRFWKEWILLTIERPENEAARGLWLLENELEWKLWIIDGGKT